MEERVKCPACGKSLASSFLRKHIKKCQGKKSKKRGLPVQCRVCDTQISYANFQRHMNQFHHPSLEDHKPLAPPPPEPEAPAPAKLPEGKYERALSLLHKPPANVYCREELMKEILSCLASSKKVVLLITGAPGTGKTATLNHVLDELQQGGSTVLRFSGANYSDWVAVSQEDTEGTYTKRRKCVGVDHLTSDIKANLDSKTKGIVVIDDVSLLGGYDDLIHIYKAKRNASLVFVDADERKIIKYGKKFSKNEFPARVFKFLPYSAKEIETIFQGILGPLDPLFGSRAFEVLATRASTALRGDIRLAFDMARTMIQWKLNQREEITLSRYEIAEQANMQRPITLFHMLMNAPHQSLYVACALYECLKLRDVDRSWTLRNEDKCMSDLNVRFKSISTTIIPSSVPRKCEEWHRLRQIIHEENKQKEEVRAEMRGCERRKRKAEEAYHTPFSLDDVR